MLTLHNFYINRGETQLFRKLNMTLLPGCILCIHGENGIGKTSILRAISTIGTWQGDILFDNQNVNETLSTYLSFISYIGHANALDNNCTVLQNLLFWSRLKNAGSALEYAITFFELTPYLSYRVEHLSQGWQKKVELAKLHLSHSKIWLLDEPFVNLDEKGSKKLLSLIAKHALNQGITLLTAQEILNVRECNVLNLELY